MKKMLTALLLLLYCFVAGGIASAETLTIWGSITCQKRFLEPGAEALKAATGVNIKVIGIGSGQGMIALFNGKTTVATSSNDLAGSIAAARKVAKKQGKEITIPENVQFHKIFSDDIVPVVHKNNPVETLSWVQLKDINTGKIRNWKEVGGRDLPIRVITSHHGSSTKEVFNKLVMDKEEYVKNAVIVTGTRFQLSEISKYEGAIGAVSKGFQEANPEQTKVVNSDTISRPLALFTLGDPTPTAQKVIDFFLSDEGRQYCK